MKRDTDMVLRASDAHSAWWKSAEKVPTICEMMADFAADEVERQAKWLRGMLSDAIKRAEAAEAEVARLKALLEAKQPYTPRVGDVVLATCSGQEVVVVDAADKSGVQTRGTRSGSISSRCDMSHLHYRRPATASERAAAGLPPEPVEAPAAPRVLPEHLAFVEALAEERSYMANVTNSDQHGCDEAAHALRTAVARRDGGGK